MAQKLSDSWILRLFIILCGILEHDLWSFFVHIIQIGLNELLSPNNFRWRKRHVTISIVKKRFPLIFNFGNNFYWDMWHKADFRNTVWPCKEMTHSYFWVLAGSDLVYRSTFERSVFKWDKLHSQALERKNFSSVGKCLGINKPIRSIFREIHLQSIKVDFALFIKVMLFENTVHWIIYCLDLPYSNVPVLEAVLRKSNPQYHYDWLLWIFKYTVRLKYCAMD